MKKLKLLVRQIQDIDDKENKLPMELLWQLICYSPKMLPRFQQTQLLNEAKPFSLVVKDPHFSKSDLKFNGFIWGDGNRKILITHGWGSKAIDFIELINALKTIGDVQIIAFDAPGSGSSEGELSNLILFANAAIEVINTFGPPDVVIGHSLGAMANAIAITETLIKPKLQVSIAPLIKLKENFIATMNAADIPPKVQDGFFESFEELFKAKASDFKLDNYQVNNAACKHWLAYDGDDRIAPYEHLKEYLVNNLLIITREYAGLGHEKIIKDASVINDIVELVSSKFSKDLYSHTE